MADFVAPQASFSTDVLGAYLRAQAAPIQMQAAQQDIAQNQQLMALRQQAMSQQAQLFPGQLAGQGLSLEQTRIALQNARMYQQYAQQAIGQQGTQSAGAQSAAGPAGGIQSGPQTSVQGSASQSGSFDGSVSGFAPTTLSALAILRGDDPLKTAQGVQDYQLQQRKIQAQGPMNLAETVSSSPQADVIIRNNPSLQQQWVQLAPKLGLDPYRDLTPLNARRVATFAYNTLAGPAGMPAKPMPEQLKTVPTGVGGSYQIDPLTNKITEGAPSQETAQFTDKQGNVSMLPKAVGMARDLTPFNAETYVNPGTQGGMAQMIADYKIAPLSGYALRSPQGQAIMAQVMDLNPGYDATKYSAKQEASTAFAGGTLGNTVRSLSVATAHLDTLGKLVGAMDNNDTRAFNLIGNKWQEETGSAAPTNFDTAKHIVGDEVTKAIIGYGGSAGDRENATEVINRANSPAQLKGAIDTYKSLMGGQLGGLKQQYETSTGRKDFESLLSPAAKQQLTTPASGHPAAIQALLDKYK